MTHPLDPGVTPVFNPSGTFGAALSGGTASVGNFLPTDGVFKVRVNLKATKNGVLQVAVGSAGCLWIGMDANGKLQASMGSTDLTQNILIDAVDKEVVLSRSGPGAGETKLFCDGALVNAQSSNGLAFNNPIEFRTFASGAYGYSGQIDEVAFSSVPQTAAYTPTGAPTPDNEAGLLALYHFNGNLDDSAGVVSDTTAPTLSTAEVTNAAPTKMLLTFSETLKNSIPAVGAFTPSGGKTVTAVGTPIGATIELTLSAAYVAGDTITLGYTKPGADPRVQDPTGNATNSFSGFAVTNNVGVAPLYSRVDGTDPVTGQAYMILVPSTGSAHPYNSSNPTPVIIYAHGMGEDQTGLLADSLKSTCVSALLNAGYILAGTNAHGMNWGVQSAVDDYANLDRVLRAAYNVKGVGMWSQSMGGHAGLLAIAQNKVRGIVGWLGTYPSCNLAAVRAMGVYASSIDSAFNITGAAGGTYAQRTYGNEPLFIPAVGYKHIPMRIYASPGDTVIPKADATDLLQALVTGTARSNVTVVCSGQHGDPSHFVPSEYVAFFDACFSDPVPTAGALAALAAPTTTRTVSVTLQSFAGANRANLSGLKWNWRDSFFGPILSSGTAGTTNGAGVFTASVQTTHASGAAGWLEITDSDGTLTQNPVARIYAAPAAAV